MPSPQDQVRQEHPLQHLHQKVRTHVVVCIITPVAKGVSDLCNREDVATAGTPVTPSRSQSDANDTVRALMSRVSQLEASLRQQNHSGVSEQPHPPLRLGANSATPGIHQLQPPNPPVDDYSSPSADESASTDDIDAATVLEFLAWGRKKDSDFVNAPEHESGPRQPTLVQDYSSLAPAQVLTEHTRNVQLDVLEALLPNKGHIYRLVDYHNSSLVWYHGSYSSKIFTDDLRLFFNEYHGDVRHPHLNLQWLSLLFAILTGSMTCASTSTCRSWGFSEDEQPTLSLRWYEATVTCLNMAKYIENHTIYSVQAIATLTIAAHSLGNSNSQSVLLATAGRIAQSLGLHRLESEPSTASPDQLRKRELGKRVFTQLCTQDWFQIPFSESYSLNPKFCSSNVRPLNCNDDDMNVQPESTPTQASYCNYRYDIAALMPQLLDAMTSCNTMFTRYEQVLKYDDKMRKLATASMPTFLAKNAPVAAGWPNYVNWGRRSLTICAAHKIIMIHRKFVGLSFTNSAFSFTRRTCIAASKTILREAFAANDDTGPVLWIEQAFSVAAGIILSLDACHRKPTEREFSEHKQLVVDTIEYLKRFAHSKIAIRGVQLITFLLGELNKSNTESRKRARPGEDGGGSTRKRTRTFNIQSVIRDASQSLGVTSPVTTSTPTQDETFDSAGVSWDAFADLLGPQMGFDGQYLFDNFFPDQL
ncbi:hypothetical protein BDV96DRAFT_262457 [Lophiotrema nucula]|uniref:Transcription factor domain-containing protein n=1 Tax=Lophiotrema nucula TaxID=690887 RepID=A0A6A5YNL8_9PLEO|nr:hypothetical protein BDV96DRAFT_262457 [Lophiotrema nucula]